MLAGALYGVEAIPQRWLERIDQEVADRIREQTAGLLALSPLEVRRLAAAS